MSTHSKANDNEGDECVAVVPTSVSVCCCRRKVLYHAVVPLDEEIGGRAGSVSSSFSPVGSTKRSIIITAVLLFAAILLFVAGFMTGERHEERLGLSLVESSSDLLVQGDDELEIDIAGGIDVTESYEYQKFLVFAEQRSGSRFLTELLDNHPQVRCSNEELDHPGSAINVKHLSLDEYTEELEKAYQRVLQHPTHDSPRDEQTRAVGFKVMYNQGVRYYGSELMEQLNEMNIKVIHLERKNKLLQYISEMSNEKDKQMMAKSKSGEKHVAHPTSPEDAKRIRDEITVNGRPSKVLHFMQKKSGEDKEVSELVSKYLHDYVLLIYEQLSDKTEEEMAKLFDFLGVEKRQVKSTMKKIHTGKLIRTYFEEKDQEGLRAALEESEEFAWVLDGW